MSKNKIKGALWGAIVGDALGVPYEFQSPFDIPPKEFINMEGDWYRPGGRSYPQVPPGTWSDDTSLILCLLDAALNQPEKWAPAFVGRAQAWRHHGLYAVDGKKFDIGIQTAMALSDLAEGGDPLNRTDDETANGNGGLMRAMGIILPALAGGVWHLSSDTIDLLDSDRIDVYVASANQSIPTHAHPISRVCCGLYGVIAYELYRGRPILEAIDTAFDFAKAHLQQQEMKDALEKVIRYENTVFSGSGYVVDSLWTALKCVWDTHNYEDAVKRAISYGNDTDTTACITGGLAGMIYGYQGIPSKWLNQIRGKDQVEPLEQQLLELFK